MATAAWTSVSRSVSARRGLPKLFVLLLSLSAFACDGPCTNLAEQICSCEPNRTEEDACLLKVQIRSDTPVSQSEADRCAELLPLCTCDDLVAENYAVCGISNGPVALSQEN